jgi:hypothetical protein
MIKLFIMLPSEVDWAGRMIGARLSPLPGCWDAGQKHKSGAARAMVIDRPTKAMPHCAPAPPALPTPPRRHTATTRQEVRDDPYRPSPRRLLAETAQLRVEPLSFPLGFLFLARAARHAADVSIAR